MCKENSLNLSLYRGLDRRILNRRRSTLLKLSHAVASTRVFYARRLRLQDCGDKSQKMPEDSRSLLKSVALTFQHVHASTVLMWLLKVRWLHVCTHGTFSASSLLIVITSISCSVVDRYLTTQGNHSARLIIMREWPIIRF